ncbi:MAG: ribonuclease E/G, partial [Hyphomicrobiaceae bacterium]|nr:ribonuclease E/G [Hyphomicrobiaceae bacterium]
RDFEHLLRLWESVRDLTLQSTAPSLVYEEGNLIKRSIRDLYSKEINQVIVAGEEAHKEAKNFMRMLMPSHARNVLKYDDTTPLFARYRIEPQLDAMFSPLVQLKSGGYLVINQTEALVAVDVNSGKATKKFSIEETALNTNLEASEELARQLKLRDLAGLVVVDFIDMEEKRNNRAVERKFKECLRNDRARIQIGRISHFGLLEMSRQRLRTGVLEGSTMPCKCCFGTGIIRSTESVALAILRSLEDNLMTNTPHRFPVIHCANDVAMYLLNNKRNFVVDMETRYDVSIQIESSKEYQGSEFSIEQINGIDTTPFQSRRTERSIANVETNANSSDEEEERSSYTFDDDADGERRNRRRRRRRSRRLETNTSVEEDDDISLHTDLDNIDPVQINDSGPKEVSELQEETPNRRRRGRRGGRRNRSERPNSIDSQDDQDQQIHLDKTDSTGELTKKDVSSKNDSLILLETENNTWGIEESASVHHLETIDSANNLHDTKKPVSTLPTIKGLTVTDLEDEKAVFTEPSLNKKQISNNQKQPYSEFSSAFGIDSQTKLRFDRSDVDVNDLNSDRSNTENVEEVQKSQRARRSEPVATSPVLERIVITPKQKDLAGEPQKKPARKGWWQHRFGGS